MRTTSTRAVEYGGASIRAIMRARSRAPLVSARGAKVSLRNAHVVDTDEEQKVVLLHDLVPYRKSEKPAA